MKPNLLPCPFCGGAAERITLQDADNFGGDVITCSKCDCCTRVVFGEREGLLESWNTRAKSAPSPAGVDGLEVVGYLFQHEETGNVMSVDAQQVDWGFEANNPRLHRVCALADYDKAQAIIDGLRGEVAELQAMITNLSRAGIRMRTERDQHAQRIGELEGLLREAREFAAAYVSNSFFGHNARKTLARIDFALSAGKDSDQ